MGDDDRRLLIENLAEMRELQGELREFKIHVMGRVELLEKREGERGRSITTVVSLVISAAALMVSFVVHFIKGAK